MSSLKRRVLLLIILLVVTLSFGACSILSNRQLSGMGGMAEEYFNLGFNLLHSGMLTADNQTPCLLRPPGYPFFIASVLSIRRAVAHLDPTDPAAKDHQAATFDDRTAVFLAQCVLLALSTAVLFLWMSRHLLVRDAFILSLLFGCNPYMLILTGLLHYDILHVFLIILSSYVLCCAVEIRGWRHILFLALAGVLWGFSTLVRPVTLILPAFAIVLFLIHFKFSLRPTLVSAVVFTLALLVTIAPYTLRNYRHTGRVIPVNAQGYVALWSGTVRILHPSPNHFKWWNLWNDDGMEIFRRVTKTSSYSYDEYVRNIVQIEDEFAKEAAQNLRRQPGVYIANVLRNFKTIALDTNSVFIKVFQTIQQPGTIIEKKWFGLGYPQDFYPSYAAAAFELLIAILTLFGFLGISVALIRKDASLAVGGLVFLCICLAHSITLVDMMHYYVKMPFPFLFTAYFTNALSGCHLNVPFVRWKLPVVFIIYGLLIALTASLIVAIQLKLPPRVRPWAVTACKPAIASNVFQARPEFGPDKAVDNKAQTRWATDWRTQQAWLEIDLGQPTTFSQVSISELYDRIRRFELQAKEGDNYRTLLDGGRIGYDYHRHFEPITARYVRLDILDATDGPTISEFQLFAGPGPLSTGSSATTSNVFENKAVYGPDKAVDSNAVTRWATDPAIRQAWLEIDLGKTATFNQVRIRELYDRIRRFELLAKQGDNWETFINSTLMGSDYYAYFIPVTARYVRLNIIDSIAAPTICEFQLFIPSP